MWQRANARPATYLNLNLVYRVPGLQGTNTTAQTIDSLMQLQLPVGVDVEVKL
jgi:hypothetical protein